jgi:C4-type Zn-finger protein
MATSEQQVHEHEHATDNMSDWACPECMSPGGTFSMRPVEHVVTVGDSDNIVIVTIAAAVCGQCGYYSVDGPTAEMLDEIRHRLERGEVGSWQPVGIVYRSLSA